MVAALTAAAAAVSVVNSPVAAAVSCPDVEVVFARGTADRTGLGWAGKAFVDSLKWKLLGKESRPTPSTIPPAGTSRSRRRRVPSTPTSTFSTSPACVRTPRSSWVGCRKAQASSTSSPSATGPSGSSGRRRCPTPWSTTSPRSRYSVTLARRVDTGSAHPDQPALRRPGNRLVRERGPLLLQWNQLLRPFRLPLERDDQRSGHIHRRTCPRHRLLSRRPDAAAVSTAASAGPERSASVARTSRGPSGFRRQRPPLRNRVTDAQRYSLPQCVIPRFAGATHPGVSAVTPDRAS